MHILTLWPNKSASQNLTWIDTSRKMSETKPEAVQGCEYETSEVAPGASSRLGADKQCLAREGGPASSGW